MSQLVLFDDSNIPQSKGNKPLPVPLRTAKHFSFPLQYHEIEGEYLYSLQDWVRGLTGETDSAKVSDLIRKLKRESSLNSDSEKLPYVASDGKTYKRDFVIAYEAYRVAAYLRATSDRPALKRVKDYLAAAGAFIDQMQQDPRWAQARINGSIRRVEFMAILQDALRNPPVWVYGAATNEVYLGVFNRDKAQLSKALNTKSPRDKMNEIALSYLAIAEGLAAQQLGNTDIVSIDHGLSVIRSTADFIGSQVDDFQAQAGKDIITGKPLLGAGE